MTLVVLLLDEYAKAVALNCKTFVTAVTFDNVQRLLTVY